MSLTGLYLLAEAWGEVNRAEQTSPAMNSYSGSS